MQETEINGKTYYVNEDLSVKIIKGDPVQEPKYFTFIDFLDLFTEQEQLDIISAKDTNNVVKLILYKLQTQDKIDLYHSETSNSLSELVNEGLLTQQRMDEILAS